MSAQAAESGGCQVCVGPRPGRGDGSGPRLPFLRGQPRHDERLPSLRAESLRPALCIAAEARPMTIPTSPRQQLELVGLQESLRLAEAEGATPAERRRLRERLEVAHQLLIDLPAMDDIAFLHSGLCQTYLPHTRPKESDSVCRREAARFPLSLAPGVLDERRRHIPRRV